MTVNLGPLQPSRQVHVSTTRSIMKQLLSALALTALATSAGAQVTFSAGTDRAAFAAYNPNGAAAALAPTGGKEDATINTTAGVLTATFLGFEALDDDTFTFNLGAF